MKEGCKIEMSEVEQKEEKECCSEEERGGRKEQIKERERRK